MYVLYPGNHAEPILFPELLTQNLILEKLETVSPKRCFEIKYENKTARHPPHHRRFHCAHRGRFPGRRHRPPPIFR